MQSASTLSYDDLKGLTYLQVTASRIANTCPVIEQGSTNLKDIKAGTYKVEKFCMEPTSFTVKVESFKKGVPGAEFVKTKLMTRLDYTLDQMSGTMSIDGSGNVELQETDGIDIAGVTVQLPGGERVPLKFTAKKLNAKGTLDAFGGHFEVPNYRSPSLLDPTGDGVSVSGGLGSAVFSVAKVDAATGEIAGVFVTLQPSETDMAVKMPKDIKITGLWYAQLKQ